MKKIPPKNKINQKEFESVVIGHTNDLTYILHNVTSLMRRMNRDGKIEDYEFKMMHDTIDMIFRIK